MTDLASEEHLSPGDRRWLQGEFAATRHLVANLDGSTKEQIVAFREAVDARFDEHHERISALERSGTKPSGQRNRLTAALLAALAALAGAITAVASVFQTPTPKP